MSEVINHPPIDKTGWGEGPWNDEPDRIEWEHAGRPCLMVRQGEFGHWCGYVAVDPGHPMHGKDYDDVFDYDGDNSGSPHGGLTYANACNGFVCHIPQPGKPDDVWWFGFDCAHGDDFSPGIAARLRDLGMGRYRDETYRDVEYVQSETNRLAEHLAAVTA